MKTIGCVGLVAVGAALAVLAGSGSASAVSGTGTYVVASDNYFAIPPGTYNTSGPSGAPPCWWRITNSSGELRESKGTYYAASVTLFENEQFTTNGCNDWNKESAPGQDFLSSSLISPFAGSSGN